MLVSSILFTVWGTGLTEGSEPGVQYYGGLRGFGWRIMISLGVISLGAGDLSVQLNISAISQMV